MSGGRGGCGCGCGGRGGCGGGMAGYQVLTIDGLEAVRRGYRRRRGRGLGALSSPDFAKAMIGAGDKGFRDGYEGQEMSPFEPHGSSSDQLAKLRRQYEGAFARGNKLRQTLPASPAEVDGAGVPGVNPPAPGGAAPKAKGGGAATIYCAVDSGKGGWREVGGRWHYAHHEGCILSSLAARYLGDAGAWKQIYTGSKERGLLPAGSTPDKIPVRDGAGERVLFWMPDAAIERAQANGCIPAGGGGVGGSLPGWAKGLIAAGAVGGLVLLVVNSDG